MKFLVSYILIVFWSVGQVFGQERPGRGEVVKQPDAQEGFLNKPDSLQEIVVSGSLRPVLRSRTAMMVETYTSSFLKKNPTPSLFEAMQGINGVRPQVNCNVCGTGDIRINGLDGPYTMITIDGMPMVSALSTVYGLFGIPNQLIDRIEVVKGPASSLYGSESVAGLINIITKQPQKAPTLAVDLMATSWREYLADIGMRWKLAKRVNGLTGIHAYQYQEPKDHNEDQFTDMPLQSRLSLFQKFQWERTNNRIFQLAGRYFYENRWGGDLRWNRNWRGSDSVYGESIFTHRVELMGNYQLPIPENIQLSFSFNHHAQDSYYGQTYFKAAQQIGFAQLVWHRDRKGDHWMMGLANRFTRYDDNTPATFDTAKAVSMADRVWLPGMFVQYDWHPADNQEGIFGLRLDRHPVHGLVWTPRLAWKWTPQRNHSIRLNAGTGFRVVQLFTEDHAALTGARTVVLEESLLPERSANLQLQYAYQYSFPQSYIRTELSVWHTRFFNQILPDYDTDPNAILYRNLRGSSIAQGLSVSMEYRWKERIRGTAGFTWQDVNRTEELSDGTIRKQVPVLTERWSGVWQFSYALPLARVTIDYTGSVTGPMRLPILGPLDPRRPYSSIWSLQNLQVSWKHQQFEWYGGVKNLLNFTPDRGNPFLIARTQDPFDKEVSYDMNGQIIATPANPYALSFDPNYVFAPNQGRRVFLGCRLTL
jgi:outer membrane receptor for ferrienterochelin and colicins